MDVADAEQAGGEKKQPDHDGRNCNPDQQFAVHGRLISGERETIFERKLFGAICGQASETDAESIIQSRACSNRDAEQRKACNRRVSSNPSIKKRGLSGASSEAGAGWFSERERRVQRQ